MNAVELMKWLEEACKKYRLNATKSIKKNKALNEYSGDEIKQQDVDAILVDFINFIGYAHGVNYDLNTKDLNETKIVEK